MIVALVGQPNGGKSTLFNAVAGYRTVTANFPGTTVEVARSTVPLAGGSFDLLDVPGLYTLNTDAQDEQETREILLSPTQRPDVVVHVVDTSLLGRSLELTIELLELEIPLVVCLNMMDDAERKGVRVDAEHLARDLGVPVVPTTATRGQGILELFRAAVATGEEGRRGRTFAMSRDVESAVDAVAARLPADAHLPRRFLALKLLERDDALTRHLCADHPDLAAEVERACRDLEATHGRPSDVVLASERHALAMNLFEHVASVRSRGRPSWGSRADGLLLHPVWGTLALVAILLAFFGAVFGLGRMVEVPVLAGFEHLARHLAGVLPGDSLLQSLAGGLVQGFSGGVGIVLPYLVPFLVGLALLEDVGYLPRAAFLMDGLMHRIGLHGKAILPFVLGFGCTVPAIMGTRILETRRDRILTAVLVNFVPCSARSIVVFAVAGAFLGPVYALAFFVLSLVVVAVSGWLVVRIRPAASPGLILDIPPYRLPAAGAVLRKSWFRVREFIVVAWPVLVAGSLVLSLLEHYRLAGAVNGLLAPFTRGVLGLPEAVGTTLVFGILRKELSVVMLVQALGTADFGSVMSPAQIASYTAFTVFYVPCLATLAMLRVVAGTRLALLSLGLTAGVATLVALGFRGAFALAG